MITLGNKNFIFPGFKVLTVFIGKWGLSRTSAALNPEFSPYIYEFKQFFWIFRLKKCPFLVSFALQAKLTIVFVVCGRTDVTSRSREPRSGSKWNLVCRQVLGRRRAGFCFGPNPSDIAAAPAENVGAHYISIGKLKNIDEGIDGQVLANFRSQRIFAGPGALARPSRGMLHATRFLSAQGGVGGEMTAKVGAHHISIGLC